MNNVAIGYQALLANTTGTHNIAIGSSALPKSVILFKIKLIPASHQKLTPNYTTYVVLHNGTLNYIIRSNPVWVNNIYYDIDTSLKIFKTMYPRWFTLYQYFKFNQDGIPLDIFINIIHYYVDIKPN
jgi:hypothetical protein